MLEILAPTLLAASVGIMCACLWWARPDLQGNQGLRIAIIVSTIGTVGLGLVAGVEIVGRVLAVGLEDAF